MIYNQLQVGHHQRKVSQNHSVLKLLRVLLLPPHQILVYEGEQQVPDQQVQEQQVYLRISASAEDPPKVHSLNLHISCLLFLLDLTASLTKQPLCESFSTPHSETGRVSAVLCVFLTQLHLSCVCECVPPAVNLNEASGLKPS